MFQPKGYFGLWITVLATEGSDRLNVFSGSGPILFRPIYQYMPAGSIRLKSIFLLLPVKCSLPMTFHLFWKLKRGSLVSRNDIKKLQNLLNGSLHGLIWTDYVQGCHTMSRLEKEN